MLARHIGRHIPGKPTVNVQVMPGAGGIRAANFLAQQAPKDGTAITTFAGGPILEPLIGSRKVDYDSQPVHLDRRRLQGRRAVRRLGREPVQDHQGRAARAP